MTGKDLIAQFKAAPPRSAEDAERLAALAQELTGPDVQRLLEDVLAGGGDRFRVLAFQLVAEKVADKSLFTPFVRALRTAEPGLRTALLQLLPKVNNVAEHATLVALLRSPDPAVRQVAAQALPAVGGRTVFESVGAMLKEPGFPGRMEAMECLVALAPQHAVPQLAKILAVGTPAEKIKAIGHIAEPRCAMRDRLTAVEAVAAALGDPNEGVASAAITGLAALAEPDEYFYLVGSLLDSKSLVVTRAAIQGLGRCSSPQAVAALHRRLRLGPNVVRLAVLDALEAVGTSDVLAPLVEALGHPQLAVRQKAGEALSRLSGAGRLDLARTVIWLLRSRDLNVRRMAVELVQTVSDPRGELWPKLLGYLRDEDWWVRERVMDALVDMAGESLLGQLVEFLSDPSELIRRFGVDALLRLRAPGALGALVRTAGSDPDWWVRERAIEAIAAIGDMQAVPYLVQIMQKNPPLQIACLQALAQLHADGAGPQVAELLGAEDGDVQFAALSCLAALDDPAQSGAAQRLLRDPRTEVRNLARELVARWGQATSLEVVVEQPIAVLDQLLSAVAHNGGDDLILASGRRPLVKRLGRTLPLSQTVFAAERVRSLLLAQLSARQFAELEAGGEVDFSYRLETEDLRFRVNVFQQLGGITAVFRLIRAALPNLESLGLPPIVKRLADLPSGLVLVGGATGSGKSTTLAALVDHVNETSMRHVVTLEDPIEVVHPRKRSLVNQREVGTHTASFESALRSTLRQDPDVILVGEMRDLATISFAITAAETGHLVFATIHTVSAAGCVDRLVNAFPPAQQDNVRSLVAGSLRAILCQYLLPRADGPGRCVAVEVMLNNDAIASLIRKGKTFQIPQVIATSREQGMQLMDVELMRLFREGRINAEEAHAKAHSKKDFESLSGEAPRAASAPRRGQASTS
jgi:twitching motility protein PilT